MYAPELSTRLSHLKRHWESFMRHRHCSQCRRTATIWHVIRHNPAEVHLKDLWYCSPECFEKATAATLFALRTSRPKHTEVRHRIPLGLLMMSRGQVSHQQVQRALQSQRDSGRGKIGEWLEELGFSTEDQVIGALGVQWACPVFALDPKNVPSCAEMLPSRLLESLHIVPVHYASPTRTLYIGFSGDVDYAVLHAIEQILGCRTEACLVRRSSLQLILKQLCHNPRPFEIVFDQISTEEETARIVRGYTSKLRAEDVRIASCGDYLWLRLTGRQESMNLLFRKSMDEQTRTQNKVLTGAICEKSAAMRLEPPEVTASCPTLARHLLLPT